MNKRAGDPDSLDPLEMRKETTSGFVIRTELLGIIGALLLQTAVGIWWGATVTTKQDYMNAAIEDLKSEIKDSAKDRYTAKDASRDQSQIYNRIEKVETRIERLEDRGGNHVA